ncbi:MAG: MmcQ/YjbR family DNA-binding protein [Pseudomonadota bacterium]
MDVEAVKQWCAGYPGACALTSGFPGNVLAYTVGDKRFAYFKTSAPEQWRFSIRTSPSRFLELTGMPGMRPARYMGRFHWVTVVDVRSVPQAYLQELIDWSYHKAFGALSKTQQRVSGAPITR